MGTESTVAALNLLLQILTQAQGLTALIQKARAEGRDVSEDELDSLVEADDAARVALDAEIAKAMEQERQS